MKKVEEMEFISMKDWSKDMKILLLRALDFDTDGTLVLKNGEKVLDKYTNEPIKVDNMAIFPEKLPLILDGNPLSIASYLVEKESHREEMIESSRELLKKVREMEDKLERVKTLINIHNYSLPFNNAKDNLVWLLGRFEELRKAITDE